ncbi:1-acyl-sn-glycerol-3-phosphate acyltransferase [Flavobacterium macacae]|uniref:Glycerol acyltransferase n=1 Tax=Flavobacterium macacae TaxID=2488993 RepID=A0A3P3WHF5_9FLAO|nr:1-acyl-sn-glycerol-3-phosphate acyltransferase [Flavobacterium macacae]RRJ93997.1 glycerol acyltransferase [Flavobacterium macacae]
MHKYFIAIHFFISRNRIVSVFFAFLILALFGFFASKIKFEEDITKLIPKSERSDETAKVLGQLNFADKITVIFNAEKGASSNDLTEMATVFLDSLQSCDAYINSVQGQVDDENIQETFGFVYENLPLFLDDADYEKIQEKLRSDSVSETVSVNYRNIISPTGIVTKDFILQDPLGISFIALKKLQQLGTSDDFILENGFVLTKDKTKLLLFINPKLPGSETEKNTLFVAKLKSIQENLNTQFKGKTKLDYFGSALIAVANANQIKSDIQTTVFISMGALMLILCVYYRKFFIPIIIFIPTIFGVLASLALLYFLKGTISAISLSIGAVLLGVTVDYSLHILTHYKHNSDIKTLYKDITMPLIMSSTTTAVAFLCLLFVKSEALQDLGIFASSSVIITSLFSLLIIPHLYTPKPGESLERKTVLDKMAGFAFERNKILVLSSIVIIIVSLFTYQKVGFNNDISQLNYVPSDIKKAEKDLESSTSLTSKSLYVAVYGNSIDEVLQKNRKLYQDLSQEKNENKILNFSSVGSLLLSKQEQQKKIDRWNSFWDQDKKSNLTKQLISNGQKFGFKPTAYEPFYELLNKNFGQVSYEEFLKIKALYLQEFVTEKEGFFTISTLIKVNEKQREALVEKLSKDKKLILIDRQKMNETFLGELKNDFNLLVNYSFIAVVLILFLFFRRIELVLMSCIPIVITGLVTAGIMGIFDIQLNIFSLIVCTLIFGHGVDFSIFMTSALQKEYSTGKNEMGTYRTSILLAALTTILAIGALVFASHPALKSISSVSLIGVFAALLITFIFYPILFRFFLSSRVKSGKSPFEFRTLIHSTLSFIYYGLGGFLLSIFSVLFVKILPIKRQTKIRAFHYLMSKFMKSVLYTNPFIKKRIINLQNETFEKPAVIIANHTSFLDILAMGMLNPKIVFLVSDWVYNSPIFGKGVRLAGFYPVSQGLEGGVEHLREKVNQGFSLMVFPEGSRSTDNHIKRFHKGAFYLAEQFNLDILPVVIHGNSEVLPKGDFIINDGLLTLKILPRITPENKYFGENYAERTKKLSGYFKEEFQQMRMDIEDENYFKKMIIKSFAYKERAIISSVKDNLKLNLALFYNLNKVIEPKAKILRIADDYGEFDLLLALQESQRKVDSYIENSEKREIASTNYILKKRSISYLNSLENLDFKYDILIVNSEDTLLAEEAFLSNFKKVIVLDPSTATFKIL